MTVLFTHVLGLTPADQPLLEEGYVAVSQGKIQYIGTERPQGDFTQEISCEGKCLMPGLVNAHTHLPMSLLRGMGGGTNLQDWLEQHIFPAEARLDSRAVQAGTMLSIAELLAAGVTSVADMYNFCPDIGEVVMKTGINANLSRGVLCFDPDAKPEELEGIQDTLALLDHWHEKGEGQILCNLSLHGEYTSFLNPSLWEYMAKLGQERGLSIHIHVSETQSEHEEAKARHGKTPLAVLGDYGLWDQGGLAAHCVWTEPSDWALMVEKGISPVHNPVSNLKLASGIAPVPAMLQAGVCVSLGTDGVASNNNHDMWEEIKLLALLHKGISQDPKAISSRQALDIATKHGGIALGRKTGELKVGYDADLILVDMGAISLTPCHDLLENLVFSACGRDVSLTMCRGKILYQDGVHTTIDIPALKKEVEEYAVPCILGKLST